MDTNVLAIILASIAIIPSIGAVLWQIISNFRSRKRVSEGHSLEITKAATHLYRPLSDRLEKLELRTKEQEVEIDQLNEEVDAMQVQIRRLKQVNSALCNGVNMLLQQLSAHNIEPAFQIEEGLCDG